MSDEVIYREDESDVRIKRKMLSGLGTTDLVDDGEHGGNSVKLSFGRSGKRLDLGSQESFSSWSSSSFPLPLPSAASVASIVVEKERSATRFTKRISQQSSQDSVETAQQRQTQDVRRVVDFEPSRGRRRRGASSKSRKTMRDDRGGDEVDEFPKPGKMRKTTLNHIRTKRKLPKATTEAFAVLDRRVGNEATTSISSSSDRVSMSDLFSRFAAPPPPSSSVHDASESRFEDDDDESVDESQRRMRTSEKSAALEVISPSRLIQESPPPPPSREFSSVVKRVEKKKTRPYASDFIEYTLQAESKLPYDHLPRIKNKPKNANDQMSKTLARARSNALAELIETEKKRLDASNSSLVVRGANSSSRTLIVDIVRETEKVVENERNFVVPSSMCAVVSDDDETCPLTAGSSVRLVISKLNDTSGSGADRCAVLGRLGHLNDLSHIGDFRRDVRIVFHAPFFVSSSSPSPTITSCGLVTSSMLL